MWGMGINNSKCPYYDLKTGKSNHIKIYDLTNAGPTSRGK